MNPLEEQRRRDAIRALINMAVLEGMILVAVVGVYLYTNNMTYLIGGIVGATLIFGPMYWRFIREHGDALKQRKNK